MNEDSIEQLQADMATDPTTRAILDRQVENEAAHLVEICLEFALRMKHAPDPWAAKRALIDARVWLEEAKGRLDKDIIAHKGVKGTTANFDR